MDLSSWREATCRTSWGQAQAAGGRANPSRSPPPPPRGASSSWLDPAGPKASGSGWGRHLFSGPPLLGNLMTQWSGGRPGSRLPAQGSPVVSQSLVRYCCAWGGPQLPACSWTPQALPSFHKLGEVWHVLLCSWPPQFWTAGEGKKPDGSMKLPISHLLGWPLKTPGVPEMLLLTTGDTTRTEASWSF